MQVLESPHMAPDFRLPDFLGATVTLSEMYGAAGLLLVFYRGHWCPYCRRYLAKLTASACRMGELGIAVAAISPEPPATSRMLADQLCIPFRLLCDCDGQVIDQYGVRGGFRGVATPPRSMPVLPHPAVFLIDRQGVIRFKSIDRNFKRRTTMHTLFERIRKLR